MAQERGAGLGEFVSMGGLQRFGCLGVIDMGERELGARRWQVTELDEPSGSSPVEYTV